MFPGFNVETQNYQSIGKDNVCIENVTNCFVAKACEVVLGNNIDRKSLPKCLSGNNLGATACTSPCNGIASVYFGDNIYYMPDFWVPEDRGNAYGWDGTASHILTHHVFYSCLEPLPQDLITENCRIRQLDNGYFCEVGQKQEINVCQKKSFLRSVLGNHFVCASKGCGNCNFHQIDGEGDPFPNDSTENYECAPGEELASEAIFPPHPSMFVASENGVPNCVERGVNKKECTTTGTKLYCSMMYGKCNVLYVIYKRNTCIRILVTCIDDLSL